MPVNTSAIGKTYEPVLYAVGREKIREYARAVGETNPVHLDLDAARGVGYADLVAPPMFAVVYSAPSVGPPIFDPEIGLNFAMMVHGGQQFEWGPVVVAGDGITTATIVKDISRRPRAPQAPVRPVPRHGHARAGDRGLRDGPRDVGRQARHRHRRRAGWQPDNPQRRGRSRGLKRPAAWRAAPGRRLQSRHADRA